MADHVFEVRELLLDVALVGLQTLEQVLAARERPADEAAPSGAVVAEMTLVH
jgi:hypothetical protein